MWPDNWATLPEIVLRTVVVYGVILVGVRLAGKREIGQVTPFDLVVLLLLANAVQNAMVGPDTSLVGGLLAAAVLLVLDWLIAQAIARWPRARQLVEGSPTLLVMHGQRLLKNMRQEGVDDETVQAALREHGLTDLSEVDMAVLEIDGTISIVPVGKPTQRGHHRRTRFLHRR
jgi:uncharacterized membrane protein YcaP (DUF421 family)